MKVLFISDLHLAPTKAVDDFGKSWLFNNKFVNWATDQKFDIAYVVGDCFELWQGKGFWESAKKRIELINIKYPEVLTLLKARFTMIYGNHDYEARQQFGMIERAIVSNNGINALVTHGHQYDEYFKNNFTTKVSKFGAEIWGGFEKLFGQDRMEKVLPKIESAINLNRMKNKESATKQDDLSYILKATEDAKKNGCNIAIIGHTHKPKIQQVNGVWYVNVGAWAGNERAYAAALDTTKKEIILYNFVNKNADIVAKVNI